MTDKNDIPKPVRDYMASIGKKGGEAMKGTEAARIRSAKATAARLKKEAALKEQGQVPVTPEWQRAVRDFLRETKWAGENREDTENHFNRNLARCIEHNDMRYLGTGYFELVRRHLKEK
jgi:hypothetical protein